MAGNAVLPMGGIKGGSVAVLPSAPTNVNLLLQGQTVQNSSTPTFTSDGFIPQSPNSLTLGWTTATQGTNPISSYNVYRSVNQGAFTFYAGISSTASAAAYATYVTNSGATPHSTLVNNAFVDSAATQCVGYPRGAGAVSFPNANGYSYKVSAVDTLGGEGALSDVMIAPLYIHGERVLLMDAFDNAPNYAAADGGTTPSGSSITMKITHNAQGFSNPYCGNGAVEWNLCLKAFNYVNIVTKTSSAGLHYTLAPELVGDTTLQLLHVGGSGSIDSASYTTILTSAYVNVKIPVADLMTDYTSGSAALQNAYYKVTLAFQGGGTTDAFWIDSWYFSVA